MSSRMIDVEPLSVSMLIYCQLGKISYLSPCRFVVGMLSVHYRFGIGIVGLVSVPGTVLVFGFESVSCQLSNGPNWPIPYRILPEISPVVYVSAATLSVTAVRFNEPFFSYCRFRVSLAGVTGVLCLKNYHFLYFSNYLLPILFVLEVVWPCLFDSSRRPSH